jgi:hypothetical protein
VEQSPIVVEEPIMRRAVIAGAVLGFVVLGTAGTALAAPPEIQQRSCEASGGTFDRDHGVKSCTTTTQSTQLTGPFTSVIGSPGNFLTGISVRTDVLEVATTQTQKGNGEVTTTQSVTVLSSTVTGRCSQQIAFVNFEVDDSVCVQNGAFLAATPLGPA